MKVFHIPSPEYQPIFEYILSYLESNITGFRSIEASRDFANVPNEQDVYLMISTTSRTCGFQDVVKYILKLRRLYAKLKLKLVIGGSFISLLDNVQLIKEFPEISYLCAGPGENFLKELFTNGLEPGTYNGHDFGKSVNYYLTDNQYNNIDRYNEFYVNITFNDNNCDWGKCLFCHHFCDKVKSKSTSDELFYIIDRYAKDRKHYTFYLYDNHTDVIELNKLLNYISKKDYAERIKLVLFGVKASDDLNALNESLSKFKSNPIEEISMGVEFYHQELLNKYRKGITIKQIDKSIEWIDNRKIKLFNYLLFGVPGSTIEHRAKYKEFIDKYRRHNFLGSFFRLDEGMRMYDMLDHFGIKIKRRYKTNHLIGFDNSGFNPIETKWIDFDHFDRELDLWITRTDDLSRHKELLCDLPMTNIIHSNSDKKVYKYIVNP